MGSVQVETDAAMEVIATETFEADKVKEAVSSEEAVASDEAAKVQAIKTECETDLAEAIPVLEKAVKALNTLTKGDIGEVKVRYGVTSFLPDVCWYHCKA